MTKKFIFGLGNYGADYQDTRHNAGFLFINYLQEKLDLPSFSYNKKTLSEITSSRELYLVKPRTYMNLSGGAVAKTLSYFSSFDFDNLAQFDFNQVLVAHDDLDLKIGEFKVQKGVGPKQHNGLLSIYQALGSQDFWHIRFGIDDRESSRKIPPENYVLQKMTQDQIKKLTANFSQITQRLGFVN